MSAELLREAAALMRRERGTHEFYRAVADWLVSVDAEEWCCPECKYDPTNENTLVERGVDVARAYLGRDA